MTNYIAYYRVSLKDETRQKGLGLLAQTRSVHEYINNNNGNLIAEFSERESGKNDNRIELNKALRLCKETNATLVISKIDRLSRKVSFVFALKDSGINFIALDLPSFNTLTLAIFTSLAQQERELISSRTKDALNELKKRNVKLGVPENLINNLDVAITNSINSRKEKAKNNENNKKSYAMIQLLRNVNMSLNQCAKYLNERCFLTSQNRRHTATSVKNLIRLYQ